MTIDRNHGIHILNLQNVFCENATCFQLIGVRISQLLVQCDILKVVMLTTEAVLFCYNIRYICLT